MEKRIKIDVSENDTIQNLHFTYISYMSILQFLLNQETIQNVEMFDRKWNEAVELNKQLDVEKRKIEKKYKPTGNWDRFEFDFDNQEVVFVKHDA